MLFAYNKFINKFYIIIIILYSFFVRSLVNKSRYLFIMLKQILVPELNYNAVHVYPYEIGIMINDY